MLQSAVFAGSGKIHHSVCDGLLAFFHPHGFLKFKINNGGA
jgi:hypothetical protein